MTLEEFMVGAALHRHPRSLLRVGQSYMDYLYEVRPDLYKEITGTDSDPYYNNGRLSEFWQWLSENWCHSVPLESDAELKAEEGLPISVETWRQQ